MVLFSERKEMEKEFKEWAKQKKVPVNVFNVITFLSVKGYLKEDMRSTK
jgi:hypothetical protein